MRWLMIFAVAVGHRPCPSRSGASVPAAYADVVARARTLVCERLAPRVPGLQVAVAVDGRLVWSEAFGYADLERRRPVSRETQFRIGSVSKPLTAAAVAQLYEQGELDLDAPVQRYVASFPAKRYPITTRELAGHLAGIRHYRDQEFLLNRHFAGVVDGLSIFEDDSLLFPPGTKFSYSSYGWNLVSAVVEGASGEGFLPYMSEHVFRPLGMTHTAPDRVDSVVPHRTQFYDRDSTGHFTIAPPVDNSYKWAGGGFLSTAEDLVKFGSALLAEGFLKAETLTLLFTTQRTSAGEPTGYGIGWFVGSDSLGHRRVFHGGGSVGGTAAFGVDRDSRVVVAILTNLTEAPLDSGSGIPALFDRPAAVAPEPQATGYRVVRRYPLGGEGGWDYLTLDPATRRLFVSRGTRVAVIDADSGRVVGEIPNTPGVHGVALAPDLGRGATSNGRDQSVTIFDLRSLAALGTVRVTGGNPDAIVYEPVTHRVFTFNGAGQNATAIDVSAGAVVGTVALGGKPEFAVATGDGRIYANIENTAELVVLDARALAVTARWPLAPCADPTGLALDAAHSRLFVGCSNRLMAVVDGASGRVLTTLPIGAGVDGTAFDPGTGLAFSSNGEGSVTVVREVTPDSFSVVDTVATQRGARTVALDPRTHALFLATAEFGPAPAVTPEQPRPRPAIVPGSFVILVVGR